jgi:hypothetical protein
MGERDCDRVIVELSNLGAGLLRLSKMGVNKEIKIKLGKRVGGGEDQSRGGGGEVRGREQAIRD